METTVGVRATPIEKLLSAMMSLLLSDHYWARAIGVVKEKDSEVE